MKKLQVDSGTEVYRIAGGGVLRFNPMDPGLYLRFEQLPERLEGISAHSLPQADRAVKELLDWALGPGNDVDRALCGVSVFARGTNGRPVLQNLLDALAPVLREGAERCAQMQEQQI